MENNRYNEEFLQSVRQELVVLLERVLADELLVVQASRSIWRLGAKLYSDDPLFHVLQGIDSQTDHLPLGRERSSWQAEALSTKDTEIREAEDRFAETGKSACRALLLALKNSNG